jgi:hypothetical protein
MIPIKDNINSTEYKYKINFTEIMQQLYFLQFDTS